MRAGGPVCPGPDRSEVVTTPSRTPRVAERLASSRAADLRDAVARFTPHEVTPVGPALDGLVGVVPLRSTNLVFVRYGGDVIVESAPTGPRVVATVPLGPMDVTIGHGSSSATMHRGFVLPSSERTLMRPDPWAGALVVAVEEQRVQEHQRVVLGEGAVTWPKRPTPLLTHACRRAWSETTSIPIDTPDHIATVLLDTLETELLTALVLSWGGPEAPISERVRGRIAMLREWLDVNHGLSITIADMAVEVGVSVRQLQAMVQGELGITPTQMLREVRLDHARRLLHSSDPDRTTVAAIAFECGFGHLGRFSAQYNQRFGEPPSMSLRYRSVPA